jgi:hypothetical protein
MERGTLKWECKQYFIGIFKCEVLMKRLHKKLLIGWMAVTMLTVSVPTHSFIFNITDLRNVSSRIVLATRSAMSSLRNFLIPVRFATMSTVHLPKAQPSKIGEKVANFAATAADKVGSAYDDAKKRAQGTKESLAIKTQKAQQSVKQQLGFWQRLSLGRIFGDEVQLV